MTKKKSSTPRAAKVPRVKQPASAAPPVAPVAVAPAVETVAAQKSLAVELDGTRREIETPMVGDVPAGRFSATTAKGVYIYELEAIDAEGQRVYRHVSTEPV